MDFVVSLELNITADDIQEAIANFLDDTRDIVADGCSTFSVNGVPTRYGDAEGGRS